MAGRTINKKTDAEVQKAKEIREGKDKSSVFCEGEKNVEELLRSQWSPTAVYCTAGTLSKAKKLLGAHHKESIPIYILTDTVMSYLSDLDSAPGLLATSKRPKDKMILKNQFDPPLVLLLHGLQLPQNLGALLRTGEACGVNDVWLTKNTVDAFGPKSIRGSSGSVFRLPIHQGWDFKKAVEELNSQNISIVAAHQKGTVDYDKVDWTRPTALMAGAEGAGFSSEDLGRIHHTVRIPMSGQIESLNVGVAVAVCLFEAARQRRKQGVTN